MSDSCRPATVRRQASKPLGPDLEILPGDLDADGSNKPLPIPADEPEVGLSQKGSGEDAIVRRETEV